MNVKGFFGRLMGVAAAITAGIGLKGRALEVKPETAPIPYAPEPGRYIPGRRGRWRAKIRSNATGRAHSKFDLWLLRRRGMQITSIRAVFGQTGAQWAMAS